MRVKCIRDDWTNRYNVTKLPVAGKIYTVVDKACNPFSGRMGYVLAEMQPGHYWWDKFFVPVDEKGTEKSVARLREIADLASAGKSQTFKPTPGDRKRKKERT